MATNFYDVFKVPSIPENRNYWMVRTNSGAFYDDFVLNGYIAIAWDYITLNIMFNNPENVVRAIIESTEKSSPSLQDELEDESPEDERGTKSKITLIYNKLKRFIYEFREGDVVLIPNKDSEKISIGIIESPVFENPQYIKEYLDKDPSSELSLCPYHKRRKVQWYKHLNKNTADIYLVKAFSSHHALYNMQEYAPYIDRTLYPIYRKGDELHSTIHAGHKAGLSLRELNKLTSSLLGLLDDASKQLGLPFSDDELQVKINIHSPGLIEIIGYAFSAGIVLAAVTFSINHLINGGSLSIKYKKDLTGNIEFELKTDSKGIKGHEETSRKLDLKEKKAFAKIAKDLDVKSPELINQLFDKYPIHSETSQLPAPASTEKEIPDTQVKSEVVEDDE